MVHNRLRGALLGLATATAFFASAPTADAAFIIDYTGTNYPSQVSAEAEFAFVDQGGNVRLDLNLENTSTIDSTITSFAFDLPTGTMVLSFNEAAGWELSSDTSVSPFGSFTVCIETDSNDNCTGGNPAGGLTRDQSVTFSFVLDTVLNAALFEVASFSLYSNPTDTTSIARF